MSEIVLAGGDVNVDAVVRVGERIQANARWLEEHRDELERALR